ncbi:MAG: NADH-ubiquinone oxidoreductase-F iron-sulfur binding region domain-containing protein [Candidatus Aminicenantia bacterium]
MSVLRNPNDLKKYRDKLERDSKKLKFISISSGTCGQARGSLKVIKAMEEVLKEEKKDIPFKITGCHGYCSAEPNIILFPDGIFYVNLVPENAREVLESFFNRRVDEKFLYREKQKFFAKLEEIPFYNPQQRILLSDNPFIDPTKIDDYILRGGYGALAKTLSMKPEEIIEEIKKSGLRGRGGAGFPTGRKWEIARAQNSDIKYIVCNGDEGDPGAYMDRSLLEGNPHLVLEGMIIGGYAIGAKEGWFYVRDEYPLAVKHLTIAISQAKSLGLLGENILGSRFNFDVKIVRGAGAFVCGEETALIASIEGKRGNPRPRPPYPAQEGLFGKPTNINNVETWANVTRIMEKGADWFASIGTENSKGTKIFSLVGKVKNTGLVEVPMGMTIKELVYEVGGGGQNGKKIKAIQIGGPSGGCIPHELFHLPIDYESLTSAGAIMGSGGMIVMDEDTCMVDVARYFLNFTQEESCGKCVPCRIGTRQMYEILQKITEGKGEMEDIEKLEKLAFTVKNASLCGLGQTAPNPVITTLKYFKDEYIAHVKDKRCPALVCKELINYYIDPDKCVGCLLCLKNCPADAILGANKMIHVIVQEKCIKCGACMDICPPKVSAVVKVSGAKIEGPKEPVSVSEWKKSKKES